MIISKRTHPTLFELAAERPERVVLPGEAFEVPDQAYDKFLTESLKDHPHRSFGEHSAIAALAALTHPEHRRQPKVVNPPPTVANAEAQGFQSAPSMGETNTLIRETNERIAETNRLVRVLVALAILLAAMMFVVFAAKAAPEPPVPPVVDFDAAHFLALHPYVFAQVGRVPIPLPVAASSSNPLYVICSSGCSAAGSFADNSAFTVGTTPVSILGAYYTSGSAPTLSSGNAARVRMDANSYLAVDCVVGCAGGSFNNNSDAVATSSTNGQSAAWLYGFNGTSWDRLRVDASKNLDVNINASTTVPVSGTFWQTTQPVSGTFWQATQPVSIADGSNTTQGAKADAKSAATDTTAVTIMQVTKEISYMEQNPASRAVTNAGTFAVQDSSTESNTSTIAGAVSSSKMQSNTAQIGGTAVVANPCQEATPTTVAISQTASTKIIAAASSKKNYICSILIVAGAAEIPSIVEGTGTVCATSTTAVVGSTTTANGMSLAANGGFAIGNGNAAVIPGIGTNVDTCLYQNGSNRLSGFISYVQE